jgi:hypothetical protein
MFRPMGTIRQTACAHVHMTLSVALLVACIANLALLCSWL